ncbi:MAG: hypothetical protein Q8882_03040 [Bacillota bacterium]|nr:hypothetical protein [Bacillota bacterium]
MKSFKKILSAILPVGFTLMLLIKNELCTEALTSGISICLTVLAPSLFAFIFATSLLLESFGSVIGPLFAPVLCPIFNISSEACTPFILGLLGGFPAGAQITGSIYSQGKISKKEAERLLSFCNNAGPMFVIAAVGASVFGSSETGRLLYCVHIASAIIVGLVTRPLGYKFQKTSPSLKDAWNSCRIPSFKSLFPKCCASSVKLMSLICGNFLVFRVIIALLSSANIIPIVPKEILNGIIEITSGILSLPVTPGGIISASILLGFGGLCVHMQTEYVLMDTGLSTTRYYIGKLLQGGISGSLTYVLLQNRIIEASGGFESISSQALCLIAAAVLLLCLLSVIAGKKAAMHT